MEGCGEGLAPWLPRVELVRIERSMTVLENLRRCWRSGGIVEGVGVVVVLVKVGIIYSVIKIVILA